MTTMRAAWVICDADGEAEDGGCDSQHPHDHSISKVTEVVADAVHLGWHITKGSDGETRHICPDCWDRGRR